MKNSIKFFLAAGLLFAYFVVSADHSDAATKVPMEIKTPTVWTKAGSPYYISVLTYVKAPLTIEPGVVVKLSKDSYLYIKSSLTAVGTENEKIIFTSIKDDSNGGDTNGDGNATYPTPADWTQIDVYTPEQVKFENVLIQYGSGINRVLGALSIGSSNTQVKHTELSNNGYAALEIKYNAQPTLEYNIITNNGGGVLVNNDKKAATISNSIIADNKWGASSSYYYLQNRMYALDARNNWWGDQTGPYFKRIYFGENNLEGKGNRVGDGVLFDPWLNAEPENDDSLCQKNCNSNVLFLPGIKASRLYKRTWMGTEDKLWPPNYFGEDIKDLFIREDGFSSSDAYTRDAIDEVAIPVIGGNIYKSFMNQLAGLKADKTINDYKVFAYDWRMDVEKIARDGTKYPTGATMSAVLDVNFLARFSKSKKVTIVAHSNGGLLAKAIMLELEKQGLANKVDKIIFIGTPQMGTPLATLSLLYGYDESALFGTLISRGEARRLAENMPGALGLLPSEKYFERLKDDLISIDANKSRYKNLLDSYGDTIESYAEFSNFLSAAIDKRVKPGIEDIENENVLNPILLTKAKEMHQRLDNWVPPSDVQVIQLAGWGLDTVSGIKYNEREKSGCVLGVLFPICKPTGEFEPIYEPKFTVDGDRVVTAPSALMLSENPNIKRYWVDLWSYNKGITLNREHKNLLEIAPVREFFYKTLTNQSYLSKYITNKIPLEDNLDDNRKLRMSLYSPLDIHIYDESGNHTGPKDITIDGKEGLVFEEGIPNSYYYQMGDRKYVGISENQNVDVKLEGYDLGEYTLKLEEIVPSSEGESVLNTATFANLPTTDKTIVEFSIPDSGIINMSKLAADINGDGKNDYTVEKVIDGIAVLDNMPPAIDLKTPENGKEYLNNQIMKIEYTVTDNISLVENIDVQLLYDDQEIKTSEIDLSLEAPGLHSFKIVAIDEVGNRSEYASQFVIKATPETIYQNLDHYLQEGRINDEKTVDFLEKKTKQLFHIEDMIDKLQVIKNENPENNQIKLFDKKIDDINTFINDKFIQNISPLVKDILILNLEYIKL